MDRAQYRIKNSAFEGVPVRAFWAFLVPRVYFGVRKMRKKFHKVCSLGCDLLRVTVLRFSLSPSNAVTAVYDHLCQLMASFHNFLHLLASFGNTWQPSTTTSTIPSTKAKDLIFYMIYHIVWH